MYKEKKITTVSVELSKKRKLEKKNIPLSNFLGQAIDAWEQGKFEFDYTKRC